jgi:hypothetical protein
MEQKDREMRKYELILAVVSLALLFLLMIGMAGCATPNPRLQKKHYDKFIYYGGKIDTVVRTVPVEVIIKGKDGKDSLIYVDVPVKCPEATIEYKDRWHIRRMDKAERDSLKHVKKMAEIHANFVIDSLNKVIKIERQKKGQEKQKSKGEKNKKSGGWANPWLWVIVLGMLVTAIYLIKKQ